MYVGRLEGESGTIYLIYYSPLNIAHAVAHQLCDGLM